MMLISLRIASTTWSSATPDPGAQGAIVTSMGALKFGAVSRPV